MKKIIKILVKYAYKKEVEVINSNHYREIEQYKFMLEKQKREYDIQISNLKQQLNCYKNMLALYKIMHK